MLGRLQRKEIQLRLTEARISNAVPIKKFEVEGLSDFVVIAGPNGVGKTTLLTHIMNVFRQARPAGNSVTVELTSKEEIELARVRQPDANVLDTRNQGDVNALKAIIQRASKRRNFKSKVLYYESNRNISQVGKLAFQFDFPDPYEENIGWDFTMQPLHSRWQDTQDTIFKKIHQQNNQIANRARQLKNSGQDSMNLNFSDPLDQFREPFSSLLAPKSLSKINLANQQILYKTKDGQELPIQTLSSGEKEVVSIVFDFILRKPSDCIVFFDEPELHLHPELLVRLVNTLRMAGERNQFIFVTHSPEIVSASLDDSVVLLTPPTEEGDNQAKIVDRDDETAEALRWLGQSVGVVSLGKKIVLIEGDNASLDKHIYGALSRTRFPDLVMVPMGGRQTIEDVDNAIEKVISKTLWGIDFYMIVDRDVGKKLDTSERVQALSRYHLENYFLDPEILAHCFEDFEDEGSWLRNAGEIENALVGYAKEFLPYAAALRASREVRLSCGNVSVKPRNVVGMDEQQLVTAFQEMAVEEAARLNAALDAAAVEKIVRREFQFLEASIDDGTWINEIPGKPVLKKFCSASNITVGRLRNLYLREAEKLGAEPFDDVLSILRKFSDVGATPQVTQSVLADS